MNKLLTYIHCQKNQNIRFKVLPAQLLAKEHISLRTSTDAVVLSAPRAPTVSIETSEKPLLHLTEQASQYEQGATDKPN